MRGAGFLAIWSDIEPNTLTDYRHWLTREHTTERVTTKGFLAVRDSAPTARNSIASSFSTSWKHPKCWTAPPTWRVSTHRRHGRSASCRSSAILYAAAAS